MVVSWIKLMIDEHLRTSLSHHEITHDLWTHIQRNYQSGIATGSFLKAELANYRQKGLAMEAYYGKLTQLWTSMTDYQRAKTMA